MAVPGGPPPGGWHRITTDDIPEEWRRTTDQATRLLPEQEVALRQRLRIPPNVAPEYQVACELPDFPVAHAWLQWCSQGPHENDAPIMITARCQWLDRPQLLHASLQGLLSHGRPVPAWVGAWLPRR